MRTIIEITEDQVKALDEVSELEETSRTALIRRAIDRFLAETRVGHAARQEVFGLWSDREKTTLQPPAVRGALTPPDLSPELAMAAVERLSELAENTRIDSVDELPLKDDARPAARPVREATLASTDPLAAFFLTNR